MFGRVDVQAPFKFGEAQEKRVPQAKITMTGLSRKNVFNDIVHDPKSAGPRIAPQFAFRLIRPCK